MRELSHLSLMLKINSVNVQYNNQVRDYNKNCKHDDAPDSLYGAVQLIQGVKSLKFYDRGLLF